MVNISKMFNKESINKFLSELKTNKQYQFYVVFFIFFVEVVILGVFGYFIYANYSQLSEKTEKLVFIQKPSEYNLTQNYVEGMEGNKELSLYTVLDAYGNMAEEQQRLSLYFDRLQTPYNYFMKYLFLPSLNVWDEPYSDGIAIDLVGQKFLEKNPYVDTNLLSTWSDFFKFVGENLQPNQVNDIQIGKIIDMYIDKDGELRKGQSQASKKTTIKGDPYFAIPITVSFESPERASFLMLIDKLSTTSNKRNITLINKFMYNLWEAIKTKKATKIELELLKLRQAKGEEPTKKRNIEEQELVFGDFTMQEVNEYLGEIFYKRIKTEYETLTKEELKELCDQRRIQCQILDPKEKTIEKLRAAEYIKDADGLEELTKQELKNRLDGKSIKYTSSDSKAQLITFLREATGNPLLDIEVINMAIKNTMNCEEQDELNLGSKCLYDFREEYRTLPTLAYAVGLDKNQMLGLKRFLKELPPAIDVEEFSFRKNYLPTESDDNYYGEIKIMVYGKGISDDELEEAQDVLGKKCFNQEQKLTTKYSINVINDRLKEFSENNTQFENKTEMDYIELKNIIVSIDEEFEKMNNYNKMIKTFELYRMLNVNNLCKIK